MFRSIQYGASRAICFALAGLFILYGAAHAETLNANKRHQHTNQMQQALEFAVNEGHRLLNTPLLHDIPSADSYSEQNPTAVERSAPSKHHQTKVLPPTQQALSHSEVQSKKVQSKTPSDALKTKKTVSGSMSLNLTVGEIKLLEDIRVSRVAIGNGDIIKTKVIPSDQFLIIAEQPGFTSLHLWGRDGKVYRYKVNVVEYQDIQPDALSKTVTMQVKIVEFREQALKEIGVNWLKSINGPTLAYAADGVSNNYFRPSAAQSLGNLPNRLQGEAAYFGIASQITSTINYLQQNGDAVMLAEPMLNCLSGGKASFLAGGEVPFPVVGANGSTSVQFKNYGIQLEIAPTVERGGLISTRISTEVSQIDGSVTVLGAPGFLTRRTDTELNVRAGETIVISGLVSQSASQDVEAVPGIGNLPILGELFKSKRFNNRLTQLVIFVTPDVVDPEQQLQLRANSLLDSERTVKGGSIQQILRQGLSEIVPSF